VRQGYNRARSSADQTVLDSS